MQVLVVCDDLTGSNATGALYSRLGLRAVTTGMLEQIPRFAAEVDVLLVNSGSRHFDAHRAYHAVRDIVERAGGAPLVVKRIDTTCRGNVGAELDAVLDAMTSRSPHERLRVIAVPAFPDAGRTTVGGLQLLDGQPLSRTEVAHDPLAPVKESRIKSLLAAHTTRTIAEIALDVVEAGAHSLIPALRDSAADIVVCDATDNEHLRTIATAIAELSSVTDQRWIVLDSGPFGAALAVALDLHAEHVTQGCLLAIVGSQTERTREQLAHAELTMNARWVDLEAAAPAPDRVVAQLRSLADSGARVLGVRVIGNLLGDTSEARTASAEEILRCLGQITASAVEELRPVGLYASGGEVAATVASALSADGFAIETQLQPLAVAGHLVGGPNDGLAFATKGGLIGASDAASACLEHLWATHTRNSIRSDSLRRAERRRTGEQPRKEVTT